MLTVVARVRSWSTRKKLIIAGIILLVLLIGLITLLRGNGEVAGEVTQAPPLVTVRSVAELSSQTAPLPLSGEIRSKAEATIRTESSGQITRAYRSLGDYVPAGAIIAEMENSSQRAQVLQAEGSLDAAKASLAKVTGGARTEQRAILEAALESAKTTTVTALLTGYASIGSAVKESADQMFSNPDTANPKFNLTTADSQAKINLESERAYLNTTLSWADEQSRLIATQANLGAELDRAEQELRRARNFMDTLIRALDAAVSSPSATDADIAAFRSEAAAARTTLTTSLSGIASARSTLVSAQKNLEQGLSGGQSEDVLSAQASVKQAEGAYAGALANLEKTLIRAPISGTINSLTIELGDFVSAFTEVATVANNNALEVVAFITEGDRANVRVGAKAVIEGRIEGVVTRVAPAADPTTRKIEVKIGITGDQTLANNQSVTLTIERTSSSLPTAVSTTVTIPITALKIGAQTTVVFGVNEENRLVAKSVVVGTLLGDRVQIREGLTFEDRIITDARGLREGDEVTVN